MLFSLTNTTLVVTILAMPEVSLLSLASTIDPMRAANRVTDHNCYRWRVTSPSGNPVSTSSGTLFPVDEMFDPNRVEGVLCVVASMNVFAHIDAVLKAKLRQVARRGVPIGGVEAGSWILAEAGLLDGRSATTHWQDLEDFAMAYPTINVLPDRFVLHGDRFTTGGASPALDMMLELIRARQGQSVALDVASAFIYDQSRSAHDPQPVISVGRLERSSPLVSRAIKLMESNIETPLTMALLAQTISISERKLALHFNKTLGLSPHRYYLQLRLNAARRLLIETRHSVEEIALRCGFCSGSSLARRYRSRHLENPQCTRNRHWQTGHSEASKDR